MSKEPDNTASHRARVAGGAGYAFLGRMGALIEAVSVVVFTWAYGAATFGLFAVFWSYVKVSTAVSDAAMTTAMQRFVPKAEKEDAAEQVVGFALKISFLLAFTIASATFAAAPFLAAFVSAAPEDADHLVTVIRLYAWVLPFWTLVEVATAAIRARRTFGPEIRVRIFYEQGIRLLAAVGFALAGYMTYGLFLAHLVSVILAALLAVRLVARYYDLQTIVKAPMVTARTKEMLSFGLTVMPANLIKKLFSEFPVMYLNLLLPGTAGAAAGGYYAVARKIASALQAVRLTFEYVMAPLAAEREGKGDHTAMRDMYAFATRISLSLALPFGAALILARQDILAAMEPQFQAAAAAIAILCAGRVFEAATGPSSAIIEVLAHKSLPLLNGIAGLAALLLIGDYLIPLHGVTGAALAAAIGLNVTALLAFGQTLAFFRLWPYDRQSVKPLALSTFFSLCMVALVPASLHWPAPLGAFVAVAGLLLTVMAVVRYGLPAADANALGPLGRLRSQNDNKS